jgi:hypothetical protein
MGGVPVEDRRGEERIAGIVGNRRRQPGQDRAANDGGQCRVEENACQKLRAGRRKEAVTRGPMIVNAPACRLGAHLVGNALVTDPL